jgi:hypothetical protein
MRLWGREIRRCYHFLDRSKKTNILIGKEKSLEEKRQNRERERERRERE